MTRRVLPSSARSARIPAARSFCNQNSSAICPRSSRARKTTRASLTRKVRLATILGTYQTSLTHFPYLSKEWKEHCEKERLLGVSITGQWDCSVTGNADILAKLKETAITTNEEISARFGVNPSTCITCVKPSGTLSQMVDCASGMHPRHSPYYIRRIRISATDTLFKMLKDQGVPYHPEVGQSAENATTYVLEFPVKAPQGSVYKDDLSAVGQLEHWKLVKLNYTEHNPSVTISVGENEWIAVANWVYENWDIVGGLSFLPRDSHVYQLAPYEAIDETKYEELAKRLENIDYSKIITYEKADELDLKKELACAGGTCNRIIRCSSLQPVMEKEKRRPRSARRSAPWATANACSLRSSSTVQLPSGEDTILRSLSDKLTYVKGGKGFVGICGDKLPFSEHREAAKKTFTAVKEAACSGKYDLVILDEINVAMALKLITIHEVTDLLDSVPKSCDIVFTGRHADMKVLHRADFITECVELKHPFRKKVKAKKGIEY